MRRIAILIVLTACGGGETESTWTGTVDTLASGAVRVTNPAGSDGPAAIRLASSEPDLVIGSLDASDGAEFGSISGLQVDSEGRIFVLDQVTNQLTIFDPDGTLIRTVGREGEGPGEYTVANGLVLLPSDSLVVVDQQGNRYSILNIEGEFVRSVARDLGFHGWMFRGGQIDGRVYEIFAVTSADGGDWTPALLGTALRDSAGKDTVLLPPPVPLVAGPSYESYQVTGGGGGMYLSVPFAPRAVYSLDREGGLWFASGREFRLIHASLDGDTLMEVLADAEPASVTEAEIAAWQGSDAPQQFLARGGKLDLGRIPETKPHLDDIYVAPDGMVWVSVPTGPQQTEFAVFGSGGRLLGRLQLAGFERSPWIAPVVRDGQLYVVGTDELDIERVYRFGIEAEPITR